MEAAIREREREKLDRERRKWTAREEADFLRTVLAFGVEYSRSERRYVWDRFRQLARLEKKYDDALTEYFVAFVAMCKRRAGRKLSAEEELLQASVEAIPEEKAKKVLERVELLNHLREDVIVNPELDERMRVCDTAQDLPSWWIPGKHDRDLLLGAARHGLSRMEYYVLNDPELCFKDILKRHLCGEDLLDRKEMEAFLKRSQKFQRSKPKKEEKKAKEEEEEKPEKQEETKDEKKVEETKKEEDPDAKKEEKPKEEEEEEKEKPKEEKETKGRRGKKEARKKEEESKPEEIVTETRARRKSTKDATEATKLAIEASKMAKEEAAKSKEKKAKKEEKTKEVEKKEAERKEADAKEAEKKEKSKHKEEGKEEKEAESKPEKKAEKEKVAKEDKPAVSTAASAARKRVSVSIPQPQISIQQMEQMAKGGMIYDMEVMNDLMAQTYAAAIRWPKDKILEVRLGHVVACVDSGVWPVAHDYPLGDHLLSGADDSVEVVDASATNDNAAAAVSAAAGAVQPHRDGASTPMSESSEVSLDDPNVLTHGSTRRRGRGRRPLDFSEEKSKIRALLQQPVAQEKSESAR